LISKRLTVPQIFGEPNTDTNKSCEDKVEKLMTNLSRDSVIQRVPDLKVRIASDNNIEIYMEGRKIMVGPHGLAILDAFYQPNPLSEVLSKLQMRITGAQDWMDLVTTIVNLYEAGVLRDEIRNQPTLSSAATGFDSIPVHIAMLNDRIRTSSFLKGIAEVVRPTDIVVDIGTGTGVLAIAAARAGARHVYAIEASAIGKSAQANFEANGLADRITLIEGWSTQIDLPEKADVLIAEIVGNEPLGERVLETTLDALTRLLKPNARLVPNTIKIFGLPISIPSIELTKHTVTAETAQNWKSWYGIDFTPLIKATRNSYQTFFINPSSAIDWSPLSEAILLAAVDLKDIRQLAIDNTTSVIANAPGRLEGVLVYFEIEIGPTVRLSTHPKQADKACSWRSPVWILTDPLDLSTGDCFKVTYKYRITEEQFSVSVARN
jgi:hypothetical protein